MASPVELSSLALIKIGAAPITSMLENNKRAQACAAEFDLALDELVDEHPWNCAMQRQTLAQLGTGPVFGYTYAFSLPTDPWCVRVWSTSLSPEVRWAVEGRTLVSDSTPVSIAYTARLTNPDLMIPMMATAFVYLLASKLAYGLTGKIEVAKTMRALYDEQLRRATGRDGQEESPRSFTTSRLLDVRRVGI